MGDNLGRFYDVIALVRDFQRNDPALDSELKVSINNALLPLARRYLIKLHKLDYKINIYQLGTQGTGLYRGTLLRYKDHADIYLQPNLNYCWTRFVLAKELSHLLMDTTAQFNTDIAVAIRQARLYAFYKTPDKDMPSESFALHMAFEFMLPWKWRSNIDKHKKDGLTNLQIANLVKIPEVVIELYFEDGYDANSREINEKIVTEGVK